MREWENRTCIRFKERENETSYIHFFKGTGWGKYGFIYIYLLIVLLAYVCLHRIHICNVSSRCCSFVGFLNYGCQLVSIGQYCLNHATILHEIGHTIGFWHEQSRPDRDEHIFVLVHNIDPRYLSNFLKKDRSHVDSMGVPYDYNSIMHYPESALPRQPGLVTLRSKEWGIPLGNAQELSRLDVLQANMLYRCGEFLHFIMLFLDKHWKALFAHFCFGRIWWGTCGLWMGVQSFIHKHVHKSFPVVNASSNLYHLSTVTVYFLSSRLRDTSKTCACQEANVIAHLQRCPVYSLTI